MEGLNKKIKKLSVLFIFLTVYSFGFAKNHENWKSWNITYYDYTDKETHDFVFGDFEHRIEQLETLKGLQGTRNAIIQGLNGVDNLYNFALWTWLDYLKFALCDADGLQNLSGKEIALYNEVFPSLDIFAKDFFNGVYTNTFDPAEFSFTPEKLRVGYKGVVSSLEQMKRHINIEYYLEYPSEIPQLSKKNGGNGIVVIIVLIILVGSFVTAYFKRAALMKNERIATVINKIKATKIFQKESKK